MDLHARVGQVWVCSGESIELIVSGHKNRDNEVRWHTVVLMSRDDDVRRFDQVTETAFVRAEAHDTSYVGWKRIV